MGKLLDPRNKIGGVNNELWQLCVDHVASLPYDVIVTSGQRNGNGASRHNAVNYRPAMAIDLQPLNHPDGSAASYDANVKLAVDMGVLARSSMEVHTNSASLSSNKLGWHVHISYYGTERSVNISNADSGVKVRQEPSWRITDIVPFDAATTSDVHFYATATNSTVNVKRANVADATYEMMGYYADGGRGGMRLGARKRADIYTVNDSRVDEDLVGRGDANFDSVPLPAKQKQREEAASASLASPCTLR